MPIPPFRTLQHRLNPWRGVLLPALLLLLLAGCAPETAETPAAATVPAAVAGPATTPQPTIPAAPTAAPTETPAASAVLPTPTPQVETAAQTGFDAQNTTVSLEPIVSGLELPLFLTHAGDGSGRLFVLEKTGRIRIVQDGALLATPFLDISDRVGSQRNEQGLLGLAFAPDYASSGSFFVNYTNRAGNTVVARFQVSADTRLADAASESLVLQIEQPAANHNGGMLAFGPDGYLYIGTGDGGGANDTYSNGQNPATLLGKMLRLDVSDPAVPYTIPADNPWVSADWNGADVRDEIWAIGLRNPWRYSFDRDTGDFWITDVGQNQYEEVNFVAAGSPGGLNFGWPIMESLHCLGAAECSIAGLVLPAVEYAHEGHCSITGGYVYRGSAYPALAGAYIYGDYCSGALWALIAPPGAEPQPVEMLRTGATISSFGEDEAGELYVVDYSGSIHRLTAQ